MSWTPLPEEHGVHGRGTTSPALDKGRDVPAHFAAAPVPAVEAPPAVALPETQKGDAALARYTGHRIAEQRPELPEPDDIDRQDDWCPEEPCDASEGEPSEYASCLLHP